MFQDHRVSAIVTCAGRGVRFGSNKLLVDVDGMTVIERTVRRFVTPPIDEVVVVVSAEAAADYHRILVEEAELPVRLVLGGAERFISAQRGLDATSGSLIVVHDGVRPFVNAELIDRVLTAGARHGAAMLGLPTVVQVKLVTSENVVESSLDRAQTWLGQTPQVFHRELLERAYAAAIAGGYARISDDADLVAEFAGRRASIVLGHEHNIKITTPLDLVLARQIASDIRADLVGSSSEARP